MKTLEKTSPTTDSPRQRTTFGADTVFGDDESAIVMHLGQHELCRDMLALPRRRRRAALLRWGNLKQKQFARELYSGSGESLPLLTGERSSYDYEAAYKCHAFVTTRSSFDDGDAEASLRVLQEQKAGRRRQDPITIPWLGMSGTTSSSPCCEQNRGPTGTFNARAPKRCNSDIQLQLLSVGVQ